MSKVNQRGKNDFPIRFCFANQSLAVAGCSLELLLRPPHPFPQVLDKVAVAGKRLFQLVLGPRHESISHPTSRFYLSSSEHEGCTRVSQSTPRWREQEESPVCYVLIRYQVSCKSRLRCRTIRQNSIFFCCLLYTSPSPRDLSTSRMPSSA